MSGVVVMSANPRVRVGVDPLHGVRAALMRGGEEPLVDLFAACAESADHRWLTAPGSDLRDRAAAMVAAGIPDADAERAHAVAEVTVRLAIGYALSPPLGEDPRTYARRVLLPVTGEAGGEVARKPSASTSSIRPG